jgi:hypothetical protein
MSRYHFRIVQSRAASLPILNDWAIRPGAISKLRDEVNPQIQGPGIRLTALPDHPLSEFSDLLILMADLE